ncbi:MAG: 2,4-dihydroxyhept-2-ene,7-dioic acid aldolase [Actinomycetota bacterium]
MHLNTFKSRLAARDVQYGLFLAMVDPVAAEISAGAGFDWLMVDMEHGPNDLRTVLHQLQAIAASGVPVAVRPPEGHPVIIKRLLDIGVQTLVVPMVESAEQAAALVAAMRYPPHGIRGVGTSMARAAQWNRVEGYLQSADDQLCLVCQVETPTGVAAAAEIAGVDGVDAVFVGPSDLAASMGYLGQPGHPDVHAAVSQALNAVRDAGAASGVFAATPASAGAYAAAGVTMIAVGSDIALFAKATTNLADDLRSGQRN